MEKTFKWGLIALAGLCLVSCEKTKDKEKDTPEKEPVSNGAYVLNQGNWQNPVSGGLYVIDYTENKVLPNAFQQANGTSIGDTPQCGVCYGSRIYVGTYGSNTIEIIDKSTFKSLRKISLSGSNEGTQPRGMVASGGKVYITMFDGYLARLDTVTMSIDASLKVGPNPEIPVVYKGKIYVPNSDGMNPDAYTGKVPYGKTSSVINEKDFTLEGTIDVPENPYEFFANTTGLYLMSKGNYNDIPGALYKMEGNTFRKITECTIAATGDDTFYLVNDPFYSTETREFKIFNCNSSSLKEWSPSDIIWPSNVAIDRIGKKIIVTSYIMNGQYPSYEAPGYAVLYSIEGEKIGKYDIGAGPSCIFFENE